MLATAVFDFKHVGRFNLEAAETAKHRGPYSSLDVLSKYTLNNSFKTSGAKSL